jgi:hypothetical protein
MLREVRWKIEFENNPLTLLSKVDFVILKKCRKRQEMV